MVFRSNVAYPGVISPLIFPSCSPSKIDLYQSIPKFLCKFQKRISLFQVSRFLSSAGKIILLFFSRVTKSQVVPAFSAPIPRKSNMLNFMR